MLVVPGAGTAQRAVEQLREAEIGAALAENGLDDEPPAAGDGDRGARSVWRTGFAAPDIGFVVLTETDLTGGRGGTSTKDMRTSMPSRRRNAVDPLALRAGDYVVHEQHGIGKYVEMVQRTVAGATREYLVLEYAASKRGQPGDRLFVPTDQLDEVSRYVGGEMPTLNRLGGSDWKNTKAKAKKAVKQIAAELVQLYAARQAAPGHAFGPDTPWQARAGGRVPVRRDARPDGRDRRGQGGHGEAGPDGPGGLRRRRLRQDRDRGAGGVQGGAGRQAGRGAGARPRCWPSST